VLGAILIIFAIAMILKKMKGSIEIIPDKYSYSPGETINGKLILKIKKPVQATNLIVGLKCEKNEQNYSSNSNRAQSENSSVFDFNQPLDGKKDYTPSEYTYNFSIKIPQNVSANVGGMVGNLVKSAQILMGKNSSFKWYLYSELKCSGINLSKKIQINVA